MKCPPSSKWPSPNSYRPAACQPIKSMLFEERFSQLGKTTFGMRRDDQLVRIGPPFVAHRNRFAAPDEFRAATSDAPPSAERPFAWVAVRRAVPTFHRMGRYAV